ncbi:MAG: hypothetical protein sL5_04630 [Candidatus Mesenet longicola]|uniref:Ankyrin repeat domain-containing protein n=1 Tax=Candidatus Mesenet longicola TaxID=1892558 RepID=A0A8J3HV48_9RICK|nr:MAG: hypothetical protein sGL2_04750 [Candidatus Mesenet longicola]GHM59470.1 MAG: hypothetical protein sL5_04630 [Candidatus Mesenet longicola]
MIGYNKKSPVEEEFFNAIFNNDILRVKSILDSGFDVNTTDNLGRTPIYIAAAVNRNIPMIETLSHFRPDCEKKSNLGHTPLSTILSVGDKHINKVLVIVEILLKLGAKLTTFCNGGLPLHIAIVTRRNVSIIRTLLTKDTVNIKDEHCGYTPLHLAIVYNQTNTAKMLIEYEYTDVNMRDNIGNTPLISAAKMDDQKILSFLLNHGANIYLKNTNEEDFLACVVSNGRIYNMLNKNNEFRTALEKSSIESQNKLSIFLSKPGSPRIKTFRKFNSSLPYVVPGKYTRYQHLNYENLPNYNSSMLQVVQHKNDGLSADPSRVLLSPLANISNESLELPRPGIVSSRSTVSTPGSSRWSISASVGSFSVNSPSSSLSESFMGQFGFSVRVSSTSSSGSDRVQNAKRRKLDDNDQNLDPSPNLV